MNFDRHQKQLKTLLTDRYRIWRCLVGRFTRGDWPPGADDTLPVSLTPFLFIRFLSNFTPSYSHADLGAERHLPDTVHALGQSPSYLTGMMNERQRASGGGDFAAAQIR